MVLFKLKIKGKDYNINNNKNLLKVLIYQSKTIQYGIRLAHR